MGLVNRVAPSGEALAAALDLAREISKFPQECLRNDRESVLTQWDLPEREAMLNEMRLGLDTLRSGETVEGAGRFASGEGRHGNPAPPHSY